MSRVESLRAQTREAHAHLDASIMAGRPFESRERYALFLELQYRFHRDIDALYRDAGLGALLPGLAGRRRLELIAQDLRDLGRALPAQADAPVALREGRIDPPQALGWLYVAEGSNLGAAVLLKTAAVLGLSTDFGARHLAGAPEGRGLHWKTFVEALDRAPLSADEEARVLLGGAAAFARVQDLCDEVFGAAPVA